MDLPSHVQRTKARLSAKLSIEPYQRPETTEVLIPLLDSVAETQRDSNEPANVSGSRATLRKPVKQMKCLKCNKDAVLERVVVDITTGTELGGFCDSCLNTEDNPTFEDGIWHGDSGCAVCSGDSHYQLPRIDCLIQYCDDRQDEIEYGITDRTVQLCADHLKNLLTETIEETQSSEAVALQ